MRSARSPAMRAPVKGADLSISEVHSGGGSSGGGRKPTPRWQLTKESTGGQDGRDEGGARRGDLLEPRAHNGLDEDGRSENTWAPRQRELVSRLFELGCKAGLQRGRASKRLTVDVSRIISEEDTTKRRESAPAERRRRVSAESRPLLKLLSRRSLHQVGLDGDGSLYGVNIAGTNERHGEGRA